MPHINSFETLDNAIKNAGGRPTVLEALWDGDTDGWFLVFNLYVKTGNLFWQKEEVKHLGILSLGSDIRLFDGVVPPWPEAILAKQWGRKAAEKYELTFYFPSDNKPDGDCPSWVQKHLAIQCADCGKLIIPTDSHYLPKEICFNCHLEREQKQKIKSAAPCDDGVNLYLAKDDEFENVGYCTYFKDFTIAPFVNSKVQAQLTKDPICIITLDKNDILELKKGIEALLTEKLAKYRIPLLAEEKRKFAAIHTVEYQGNEYELMGRFNQNHNEIANLIASVKLAEKALSGNYTYKIVFKNGITYRDDTILRFLNYVNNGSVNISEITERYANILSSEEVNNSLTKLQDIGCLVTRDDQATITTIGKAIL